MEGVGGGGGGGYPVVSYLLQQTLRCLCTDSDWVYAVFWRILPRNYPPPKWDSECSVLDRSKGNKRNWILVWEDGYCDFVECARSAVFTTESTPSASLSHSPPASPDHQLQDALVLDQACSTTSHMQFMQPELFFKMSHDVYNFGEGLMGKVAADNSHKWVFKEPSEADSQYPSSWQGALDPRPRTWEAQFHCGIETIAIVAVKEGMLQMGSLKKTSEDPNFVLSLQRKFNYLQSIPGVYAMQPLLMPQAASSFRKPLLPSVAGVADSWLSDPPHQPTAVDQWPPDQDLHFLSQPRPIVAAAQYTPLQIEASATAYSSMPAGLQTSFQANQHLPPQLESMQTSLQALLSRLPSVTATPPSAASSSSTSPTGHPYNILAQHFVQPAHHAPSQHALFTPGPGPGQEFFQGSHQLN